MTLAGTDKNEEDESCSCFVQSKSLWYKIHLDLADQEAFGLVEVKSYSL